GLLLSLAGGDIIGPGTQLAPSGFTTGGYVVTGVETLSTATKINLLGGATLIGSLSLLASSNGGTSGSGSSSGSNQGSGPAPGTIEVSPQSKSFGVFNQLGRSNKAYIYVFDPASKRMVVAPDYTNPSGGFRHSDLRNILGTDP